MPDNSGEKTKVGKESVSTERSFASIRKFMTQELWDFDINGKPCLAGWKFNLLRIVSISWSGLVGNRLFSRAAALSYSSLIALGPLVAIVVFLSSSFIHTDAEIHIKRALLFIAPSLQEMVTVEGETSVEMASALDKLIAQIVDGAETLVGQINTSGSTAFGIAGSFILIWVVIQLLTSVETTLNGIWGVHQGRPWSQRIVFYWTFVSLGALLGLGSTALFSASNIARMSDSVPFGGEMSGLLLALSPFLSFFMLVLLLALFYRFFPNTSVQLRPAFIGSMFTACLLILNNYISILYVQRVLSFQSLYGSVGIIPVLMIGLYFFWVLVLMGGQVTYAIQNVGFLSNQAAWKKASPLGREIVTLGAFLHIARRFLECERAPDITEISNRLHIPVNILNESLEILEQLGWITRINTDAQDSHAEVTGFRPARPLNTFTLSTFRVAFEELGISAMVPRLLKTDPLLLQYREALKSHQQEAFFTSGLQELLEGSTTQAAQP